MKIKFMLAAMAVAMISCTNSQKTENTEAEAQDNVNTEVVAIPVANNWHLVDYAGGQEVCNVDSADYTLFIDPQSNAFVMTTDCNGLSGEYVVKGDSLLFNNMTSTLMSCPTEEVETAMKTILPQITTYTVTPDSVLLLRSDARIMATFKMAPEVDLTK